MAAGILPGRAWAVVGMLVLVYMLNQWDKYQLAYLSSTSVCTGRGEPCEAVPATKLTLCGVSASAPANSTLGACQRCLEQRGLSRVNIQEGTCTDTVQFGLLNGFGFTLLYVVGSVGGGTAADALGAHKAFLVTALVVWSVAAAAQALASRFWHLLLLRLILGAAESLATPMAQAIVMRSCPLSATGTALGLLSFGVYLGGGFSSLSILMAHSALGWRGTVLVAGVAGLACAVPLWCVLPPDAGPPAPPSQPLKAEGLSEGGASGHVEQGLQAAPVVPSATRAGCGPTLQHMGHLSLAALAPNTVRWILAAAALRYVGGLSLGAFQPKYFGQAFPARADAYAVANAAIIGLGGAAASFGGGMLGDWLARRRAQTPGMPCFGRALPRASTRLLVPILGSALAVPAIALMVFVPHFGLALTGLLAQYLTAEAWFGPTLATMFRELPKSTHGTAAGLFSLVGNLVGSVGPLVLGAFVQGPFAGHIGTPLFLVVGAAYAGSIIAFAGAMGTVSAERGDSETHQLLPSQDSAEEAADGSQPQAHALARTSTP